MVWKVVRQRVVDELVSVLDTDYLDMEPIPNLTRQSLSSLSIRI